MAKGKIRPMQEPSEEELALSDGSAEGLDRTDRSQKRARKLREPPSTRPDYVEDERQDIGAVQGDIPPPSNNPKLVGILLVIIVILILIPTYDLNTITQDKYMDPLHELQDKGDTVALSGTVYDDETQAEIPNATLFIKGTGLNTTTNSEGWFEFPGLSPGKNVIVVKKDNYTTNERKIYLDGNVMGMVGSDKVEIDIFMVSGNVSAVIHTGNFDSEVYKMVRPVLQVCAILYIIAIVLIVLASFLAFKRKKFPLIAVGCIFGIIFGLSTFYIISTALSIVALIIAYKSRHEFSR